MSRMNTVDYNNESKKTKIPIKRIPALFAAVGILLVALAYKMNQETTIAIITLYFNRLDEATGGELSDLVGEIQ